MLSSPPEKATAHFDTLTGFDLSIEKLYEIGREILREKYRFKIREGFNLREINIPKRIFETNTPLGMLDEKFMRETIGYVEKKIFEDSLS